MCRHVINAQCSMFLGEKWYDCHECFAELEGRPFDVSTVTTSLVFACKKCRNQFKKDLRIFSDLDGACPHCGNAFVIQGMTPESCLLAECDAAVDVLLADNLALDVHVYLGLSTSFDHLVEPPAPRPPRIEAGPAGLGR